ncbi:MAG: o-succinylbenzoate synthase [Acidimicrobiia bacterium]|nr:o-succinylbenzoate synthase [Acidimicrobiia bacterium]
MNNIKLKRVEMYKVALQPVAPLAAAHGTIAERPIIIVRVWDADANYGWGECIAQAKSGYLAETVDSAWKALYAGVIPAALSREFENPDKLSEYLSIAMRQTPVAAAAVEMASWDMIARRQGRSLANLFGGTRSNVPAGRTLGIPPAGERLAGAVEQARRDGYQRIKIKIEPSRALSLTSEAVVAAEGVPVVADANGSFSPVEVQGLRELDAVDLAWIEQPYPAASLRASSQLRDSLSTQVALDESVSSMNAVDRIIAMHAAAGLSIKPGRLGGYGASLQVYRKAKAAGLSVWIGGMLETGIGRAHNLALASLPGFDFPGDMSPSKVYWERDLLVEPIEMVAGHIAVPDGPGIGVEVDKGHLAAATLERRVVE